MWASGGEGQYLQCPIVIHWTALTGATDNTAAPCNFKELFQAAETATSATFSAAGALAAVPFFPFPFSATSPRGFVNPRGGRYSQPIIAHISAFSRLISSLIFWLRKRNSWALSSWMLLLRPMFIRNW